MKPNRCDRKETMITKAPLPADAIPSAGAPAILQAYLQFTHLKQLYRQGWLLRGIPTERCESVAEHSFGVAMLAMLLAPRDLDPLKTLQMALIHDLGEVYAGDIVPGAGISPQEKHRLEQASVEQIFAALPEAQHYRELWLEFERGSRPEARFVRQIDRLEMAFQALVYEGQGDADLVDFYRSAAGAINSPDLRALLAQAEDHRPKRGG
jgi:putative hydrolase of HD superfamily